MYMMGGGGYSFSSLVCYYFFQYLEITDAIHMASRVYRQRIVIGLDRQSK